MLENWFGFQAFPVEALNIVIMSNIQFYRHVLTKSKHVQIDYCL